MKTFVINLDRRPERWEQAKMAFEEQGIDIIRFSGFDRKIGWQGCRDSHIFIMERCRNDAWFSIFEDDAEFINDLRFATEALGQLPSDWDALYLGASPQEPQERYSNNLFRLRNAFCMHAIVWHNRQGGAIDYILEHKGEIGKIDVFMAKEVMPRFNIFVVYPMLVHQRVTGTSDTCKRSDVTTIDSNYNKFCI